MDRARTGRDGHMTWGGSFNNGTPVVYHKRRWHPARAVAFTMRTGRKPEGYALADCDFPQCVAPDHIQDQVERISTRKQVRDLRGLPARGDECLRGHDQEEHGRYAADGTSYCCACNTESVARGAARNKEN